MPRGAAPPVLESTMARSVRSVYGDRSDLEDSLARKLRDTFYATHRELTRRWPTENVTNCQAIGTVRRAILAVTFDRVGSYRSLFIPRDPGKFRPEIADELELSAEELEAVQEETLRFDWGDAALFVPRLCTLPVLTFAVDLISATVRSGEIERYGGWGVASVQLYHWLAHEAFGRWRVKEGNFRLSTEIPNMKTIYELAVQGVLGRSYVSKIGENLPEGRRGVLSDRGDARTL